MIPHKYFAWFAACVLLMVAVARAATSNITVGASVMSPVVVEATAVTEVLSSTATGVINVTVPGPGGAPVVLEVSPVQLFTCAGLVQPEGQNMLSCLWPTSRLNQGNTPTELDPEEFFELVVNDGTLNGTEGVSLSVLEGERSQVKAIVAYN